MNKHRLMDINAFQSMLANSGHSHASSIDHELHVLGIY